MVLAPVALLGVVRVRVDRRGGLLVVELEPLAGRRRVRLELDAVVLARLRFVVALRARRRRRPSEFRLQDVLDGERQRPRTGKRRGGRLTQAGERVHRRNELGTHRSGHAGGHRGGREGGVRRVRAHRQEGAHEAERVRVHGVLRVRVAGRETVHRRRNGRRQEHTGDGGRRGDAAGRRGRCRAVGR